VEDRTVTTEEWVPPGIDITRPSIARVYDFMLGGKNNFAIDRQVGELALQIAPDAPESAIANRRFLRRVVRYMVAEAGIRQFIDIGSGLPTQGNVHEIAHEDDPAVHVVYVDNDPIVLAHGRALLADAHTTTVIQADIRDPEAILSHPEVGALIDFSQPVGLLLMAILHHLNDHEDPGGVAARLRDRMPSGSHVAISHFHNPGDALPDISKEAIAAEKLFNEKLGTGRWRTRGEILAYFGDWELLEPGLVPMPEWRPEPGTGPSRQTHTYHTFIGGMARKP
jgi:hypothetical protein